MFDPLSPNPSFLISGDRPPGFGAPLCFRLPPIRSGISFCSPAPRTISSPPPRRCLPPSRSKISSSSPATDIISSPPFRRHLPPSRSEILPPFETLARSGGCFHCCSPRWSPLPSFYVTPLGEIQFEDNKHTNQVSGKCSRRTKGYTFLHVDIEHPWLKEGGDASNKPINSVEFSRTKQFRAMNEFK